MVKNKYLRGYHKKQAIKLINFANLFQKINLGRTGLLIKMVV